MVFTVSVSDEALAALIGYLNEADKRTESRRVVRVLQQMLELEKIKPPMFSEQIEGPLMVEPRKGRFGVANPALKKVAPEKYRLQREIEKKVEAVNDGLERCGFYGFVQPYFRPGWLVEGIVQSRARRRGVVYGELGDAEALHMILDLAKMGYLSRLRPCAHCQTWLYAKFRHQNFCSMKCQQKHYTQSEEWKAHRREYMRRYYQLRQQPNIRGRARR